MYRIFNYSTFSMNLSHSWIGKYSSPMEHMGAFKDFWFYPYLRRWSKLTIVFFRWVGYNHQLDRVWLYMFVVLSNLFGEDSHFDHQLAINLFFVESFNDGRMASTGRSSTRYFLIGDSRRRADLDPQEMMLKMGGDPNDPNLTGMMIQVGAFLFFRVVYTQGTWLYK